MNSPRLILLCALLLPALVAALIAALAPAADAQRDEDEVPRNHPSTDPYTGGDPALMEAAGIVSLGGFEFGTTDTAEVDRFLELLPGIVEQIRAEKGTFR